MPDMPPLTYGQIETLLTAMLDIDPDRTSAISARFNTLRRLHFPAGVNVTTGRFKYDLDATFSTLTVFALIDALMMPQQAVALLQRAWPDAIGKAVRTILSTLVFADGKLTTVTRPADAPYLMIRPAALTQLRETQKSRVGAQHDYRPREPGELSLATPAQIEEALTEELTEGVRAPFLMIDLHSIVSWAAQAIVAAGWSSPAALGASTVTRKPII
jgi:hypothetical protein